MTQRDEKDLLRLYPDLKAQEDRLYEEHDRYFEYYLQVREKKFIISWGITVLFIVIGMLLPYMVSFSDEARNYYLTGYLVLIIMLAVSQVVNKVLLK